MSLERTKNGTDRQPRDNAPIKEGSPANPLDSSAAGGSVGVTRVDPAAPLLSHQEIGSQMKLFMQVDYAPGSPVLLPNGMTVYQILQSKMHGLLRDVGGYQHVRAPVLVKESLFQTSGHADKYRDNMFRVPVEDETFFLKPMNCPCHMDIFASENRSYRDLPVRLHDEGTLHRYESKGTLSGMARLTQFHQDDTHIFVAPEQLPEELTRLLKMIDRVYKGSGMEYSVRLSTRPEKFMGDASVWEMAEKVLEDQVKALGLQYSIDHGGGAFYGPKIDIDVTAVNGRKWQVATSQLDFQLPERFGLSYIAADSTKKRPVVIHSALFGAIERFMALYLEHTQGNLPTWLAPRQVQVLPVSEKATGYALEVVDTLRAQGFRVGFDTSGPLSGRIMSCRPLRIPYLLVVGGKEAESHSVAVRQRDGSQSTMPVGEFLEKLKRENEFSF